MRNVRLSVALGLLLGLGVPACVMDTSDEVGSEVEGLGSGSGSGSDDGSGGDDGSGSGSGSGTGDGDDDDDEPCQGEENMTEHELDCGPVHVTICCQTYPPQRAVCNEWTDENGVLNREAVCEADD